MSSVLYNLIIRPLYLFFEFVFVKGYNLTGNYGYTIILLSLAINFLVLPLYRRADAMQKEERDKEEQLAKWVDHIKKTFRGDERYMMLQTYYRQNHYRQTDSLKGTVSLLLQIPFFIAAYRFLSGVQQLQGVSFGLLRDLGRPDAMFRIGNFTVNVMPVLMTCINFVSGAIYTKGQPAKSKIQLYAMALVFLALLYRSPSGLVFYWTLNNLFSLIKNIFYKLKNPRKVLSILAAIVSPLVFILFFFVHNSITGRQKTFVAFICLVLLMPLVFYIRNSRTPVRAAVDEKAGNNSGEKPSRLLFYLGGIYLTLLVGVLIPSAVVSSSPADFIDTANYQNPLMYVLYTANIAAGYFLVWLSVFYMLASEKFRIVMIRLIWVAAGVFTVNYMFFARGMGKLSSLLVYDTMPVFTHRQQLVNLLVILAVAVVFWLIISKKQGLVSVLYLALSLAVCVMTGQNVMRNQRLLAGMKNYLKTNYSEMATIPLSKNGQNVIVFMLDRSINGYVPYMMNEKPELQEKFAGFTYYPNTVSFGTSTNTGSAALFGGYEYTPYELNLRSEETLEEKQNEALKVLPVLFEENGFEVTVCDPPYAGFTWISDLSIYDDYPGIRAYHTKGKFDKDQKDASKSVTQRNFFGYSLMKVAPLVLQKTFYDQGNYNNTDTDVPDYTEKFMDSYTVLTNLPAITRILDDDTNTFMMIDNETSHESCVLQVPEYEPVKHADNAAYEAEHQDRFTLDGITLRTDTEQRLNHYYVDMAAFLQLGEWFDYLREMGVYDNTRIILVSDHGFGMSQFANLKMESGMDLEWFTPLLMMKDFGADEYQTSWDFMTNAVTPTLAVQGVITDPVNLFTGRALNNAKKSEGDQLVFHTTRWGINDNNGNTFVKDPGNVWLSIHDDIYDFDNWKVIPDPFEQ